MELVKALRELPLHDLEVIHLRGPRPIARKNKLTKVLNLLIELFWIHVLLPLRLVQKHVDLVHMPANIAPLVSPCPVVVTIHDANFRRFPKAYDPGYRRYASLAFSLAAHRATYIVTNSQFSAEDIVKYFRAEPQKLAVVYHGLPRVLSATPLEQSPSEKPYILCVGALEPHKNVRRLVEAFARFRLSGEAVARDYQLVIVGGFGRDYRQVTATIAHHQLSDAVRLTGHVTQADLDQLYCHASVFAFPSLNEGFGFPPLEAMARGVPVVAAASGSLPEVLGDAAIYCDPFDISDIALSLSEAAFNAPLRRQLAQTGLKRVEQFSWERTALDTLHVYRKVLAQ